MFIVLHSLKMSWTAEWEDQTTETTWSFVALFIERPGQTEPSICFDGRTVHLQGTSGPIWGNSRAEFRGVRLSVTSIRSLVK